MKKLVLLSCLLALGCVKPETAPQTVYQAQASYNVAAAVGLRYVQLPRCQETISKLCAKPEVVKLVKQSDTVAYNSIKAAQQAVRTKGFSEDAVVAVSATAFSAVDAFVKITSELEVE